MIFFRALFLYTITVVVMFRPGLEAVYMSVLAWVFALFIYTTTAVPLEALAARAVAVYIFFPRRLPHRI